MRTGAHDPTRTSARVSDVGPLWTIGVLLRLDVGGPDDRRPACDFAFQQYTERLLATSRLAGNVVPKFNEALACAFVIKCVVEGVGEPVQDWLRRPPRRKQCKPSGRLKLWQASFAACGHTWDCRIT